jgi:hypothetical protein
MIESFLLPDNASDQRQRPPSALTDARLKPGMTLAALRPDRLVRRFQKVSTIFRSGYRTVGVRAQNGRHSSRKYCRRSAVSSSRPLCSGDFRATSERNALDNSLLSKDIERIDTALRPPPRYPITLIRPSLASKHACSDTAFPILMVPIALPI